MDWQNFNDYMSQRYPLIRSYVIARLLRDGVSARHTDNIMPNVVEAIRRIEYHDYDQLLADIQKVIDSECKKYIIRL